MFCAHLDTVPEPGRIEVELADGVYRSRGETILGADDKAAVTVLVELAARFAARPGRRSGSSCVFTVAEEDGLRGANELDLGSLRSPFGYALDHASPIGELITAAPTHQRLVAEFEGAEAHAGIRPEDGHSAIEAAAAAIAAMRLGRLDAETTANVGVIRAGRRSNVVAGSCRLEAEARSLEASRVAEATAAMVDACTWAASEHCCDVDIDVTEVFRGYRQASSSPAVRLAREALARCGHTPREVATGGGSDANALVARGFECVLLANGTEANHTPQRERRRRADRRDARRLRGDRRARGRAGGPLMLKLRRGTVVSVDPLTVEIGGERRRAWADEGLVGPVEARRRGGRQHRGGRPRARLGRLRHRPREPDPRAWRRPAPSGRHVMKLNYTSLQHPVEPVEARGARPDAGAPKPPVLVDPAPRPPGAGRLGRRRRRAPACGSASSRAPARRCRAGSRATSPSCASAGCSAATSPPAPLTAASTRRSASTGGIDAAARRLGWEAIVVGPGPGILGSATRLGHGGIAALDAAHAALALGLPTLVCPRLSSSDERPRHRGLSHHSAAVLELLLAPGAGAGARGRARGLAAARRRGAGGRLGAGGARRPDRDLQRAPRPRGRGDRPRRLCRAAACRRGPWAGRSAEDPLFFAAPLAAGRALAGAVGG